MNAYILNRLRCDSDYIQKRANLEKSLPHQGVKGRLRELLVESLLKPWLPPSIACGTGLILKGTDCSYFSNQEDIILFDRTLSPPILASFSASDGVFLTNSVIGRIEVKSCLNSRGVGQFLKSSLKIAKLKIVSYENSSAVTGTLNFLFAFESDLSINSNDPDAELKRLISEMRKLNIDPLGGVISMLCVADRGFWKIINTQNGRAWGRFEGNDVSDYAAYFIACVSSTSFHCHAERTGLDITKGISGGIGHFLDSPYTEVRI